MTAAPVAPQGRPQLILRLLGDDDQAGYGEMFRQVFAQPPWNEHWTPVEIARRLKATMGRPGFIGWAAESGNAPIGFVTGYPWGSLPGLGRFFYLDQLFVDQRYQRLGAGKALLAQAAGHARSCRLRGIWLLTRPGSPAERFYRHHGFRLPLPWLRLRGKILLVWWFGPEEIKS